jgi:hypothetical protein
MATNGSKEPTVRSVDAQETGGVRQDADQVPEPTRNGDVVVPFARWSRLERQLRRRQRRRNFWKEGAPLFFGIFLTTLVPSVEDVSRSMILLSWWTVACVPSLVAAVLSFMASRAADRHEAESVGCILEEMSEIRRTHANARRAK